MILLKFNIPYTRTDGPTKYTHILYVCVGVCVRMCVIVWCLYVLPLLNNLYYFEIMKIIGELAVDMNQD